MSPHAPINPFGCRSALKTPSGEYTIFRLRTLEKEGLAHLDRLPYSIRVLVENVLRQVDGESVREEDALRLARWNPKPDGQEIPYMPARVILQDFTGVPVVVDLVAMRNAVAERGGDPARINPIVPVDLVIDHSVQMDYYGSPDAYRLNVEKEFERNAERYTLLRWAQRAFNNLRVVPPGTGIIHQVNLEYLANVVATRPAENSGGGGGKSGSGGNGAPLAFPDSCVGTDSHTTMINGLGVMGWGVGGIEAEAVMLGQPYAMLAPEVIGVRLRGALPAGTNSTDLVLAMTERLRKKGVVNKFVEYFGPGLAALTVEDRAVLANMSPEYGATMGFFPVDERTIEYLRFSGRPAAHVDLVERYCKEQGLFRAVDSPEPEYTDVVDFDLGAVEPNLAGPKRPQDRVALSAMKKSFAASLRAPLKERGFALDDAAVARRATVQYESGSAPGAVQGSMKTLGEKRILDETSKPPAPTAHEEADEEPISHGAVVIASITSCTNTSNPALMIAAGLLAKKAVERGLRVKKYVKTTLAPGSRVVTDYLEKSALLPHLERLGFHVAGYGCATCIGNSGPLPEAVARAVKEADLVVAAVLSGNRNFEARINPLVKANYLASPPLVVAYALAGTVAIDLASEPLGVGADGGPVYLRDVWPSEREIAEVLRGALQPEMFAERYASVFKGDPAWRSLPVPSGGIYQWDPASTYIRRPPYFDAMPAAPPPAPDDIVGARVLGLFGDSVTTDHISPAGSIPAREPAGQWLIENGVAPADFNTFGARRGNHEVMIRGTFANIRIKNLLVPGTEGGRTIDHISGEIVTMFEAAERARAAGTPLIVIAGKEYGTGSSRDWAAKGTVLLGVRAVIAESFERIHRGNLAGMGVLPIQFVAGQNAESLGLTGREIYTIRGLADLAPGKTLTIEVRPAQNGPETGGANAGGAENARAPFRFQAIARIDTPADLEMFRHGGILPMMARRLSAA